MGKHATASTKRASAFTSPPCAFTSLVIVRMSLAIVRTSRAIVRTRLVIVRTRLVMVTTKLAVVLARRTLAGTGRFVASPSLASGFVRLVRAFTQLARCPAWLARVRAPFARAFAWLAGAVAWLAGAVAWLAGACAWRADASTCFARALACLPHACTARVLVLASVRVLPASPVWPYSASMTIAIPDMKRLPALLARARREVHAQQQEVARAVGCSLRTLSRWETGKHYPEPGEARALAYALSRASGETWRALVDALRLPLDEMLEECPNQRSSSDGPPARAAAATPAPAPAPSQETALARPAPVVVEPAALPTASPVHAEIDLQDLVDHLIRSYAEEADMSPRRLRLVVGLLLGELRMLGVGLDEAYGLVMRAPRPMRGRAR